MAAPGQNFTPFPKLPPAEILEAMQQLDVPCTMEDLTNPADWKVRAIFLALVKRLLNYSEEDARTHNFHAAEHLEFPELHEDTVPTIAFFQQCQRLLAMCGDVEPGTTDANFSLQDLKQPDGKRLRRQLSAVINFILFVESKEPTYQGMAERTELLRAQKQELEQECARLDRERAAATHQRQVEQPEADRIGTENAAKAEQVSSLWNRQTELHKEKQALKKQLGEAQDTLNETKFQLQDAAKERDTLKAQVVPEPRKLKNDLVGLQGGVASAREEVRTLELQLAQHGKQREELERVEQQLEGAVTLQAECEAAQGKVKEAQRQIDDSKAHVAKVESETTKTQHDIRAFNTRIENARAELERARERHREKLTLLQQTHADAQQRWAHVEKENNVSSRQLDDNNASIRDVKERLHRERLEHEEEVHTVRQQQQQLAIQVKAYHADLLATMKSVSAQQHADVF